MYLLPAIDILGGKAVRLAKGDYNQVTVYNDDPVAQARVFEQIGAQWVHVVDLDGARSGVPENIAIVERIVRETSLSVEIGGGIRSLETLKRLADAGAARMVLGTALVNDPELAHAAIAAVGGDRLTAGIDAKGGEVAVSGWIEGSGVAAADLARAMGAAGFKHIVYTDIARDGMQTGIDVQAYVDRRTRSATPSSPAAAGKPRRHRAPGAGGGKHRGRYHRPRRVRGHARRGRRRRPLRRVDRFAILTTQERLPFASRRSRALRAPARDVSRSRNAAAGAFPPISLSPSR